MLKQILEELVINIQGGDLTSYSKELIAHAQAEIEKLVMSEEEIFKIIPCEVDYLADYMPEWGEGMRAKILPLEGKYYGTEIEIDMEKNHPNNDTLIKVWYCGNYEPSDRELAAEKITRKEWDNNKLETPRDNGWGDKTDKAREVFEICDSHFESQDCYELAQMICNSINHLSRGKG
jgi:hypothetical protein